MLFVGKFIIVSDVIVFNASTEVGTVVVEVNGVFITFIGVKGLTIRVKANYIRHNKKYVCQHPTGKLESVGGAFPKVQGSNQHILEVGGPIYDSCVRSKIPLSLQISPFPLDFVLPEDVILVFLTRGSLMKEA